jgi:hypothetical protein
LKKSAKVCILLDCSDKSEAIYVYHGESDWLYDFKSVQSDLRYCESLTHKIYKTITKKRIGYMKPLSRLMASEIKIQISKF